MRFLIDMPLSPALAEWLNRNGHDAIHASAIGLSAASDVVILSEAERDHRIVITADLDYPRLLALSGADRPSVILYRGGNYSELQMLTLLKSVLAHVTGLRPTGLFVVVDHERIRKRDMPLR